MLKIAFARDAGIILLAALLGSPAMAGDVRHLTIPKNVWGTWALKPDQCAANDASLISIREGEALDRRTIARWSMWSKPPARPGRSTRRT